MSRTDRLAAPLALALSAVLLAAVGACGSEGDGSADEPGDDAATEIAGAQRLPAPDVGGLSLPAVTAAGGAEPFPFVADEDGVLLVYFGYTHCPDVCPTTLADVRTALRDLGDDAERVELAMATIDPGRDTAAVLDPYVTSFVDGAVALRTTDDAELAPVAEEFGVTYDVSTGADGEIEVVHSGSLYAVDDTGDLIVTWSFGTPASDIANDLRLILDGAA